MERSLDNTSSDNSTCPPKKKRGGGKSIVTYRFYAASLTFCQVQFIDCPVKINLTRHFVLGLETFSWSPAHVSSGLSSLTFSG